LPLLKFQPSYLRSAVREEECDPSNSRPTERRVGHLVISFGATKPPAHPEDGDGVSSRIVGKPSHSDAAVCQRKFNWILLPRKLQDLSSAVTKPR